jgi:SOS-response transcriptional repressor LexA
MIAAPRDWCPNPVTTSCHQILLNGKIVIAWHKDRGLTVSRLRRFDHTEVLNPENHGYEAITLGAKQRWTVLARVLWWIAMAP